MLKSEKYRRQHEEMIAIANEIVPFLDSNILEKEGESEKVCRLFSTLFGKLNMHLAMEDKALYPRLLKVEDDKVKNMAQKFIDEMGGIADAVQIFQKKWNIALKVREDIEGFITEAKGLYGALADRIDRENNQLYKLYDEI